jgi:hypothetical protein
MNISWKDMYFLRDTSLVPDRSEKQKLFLFIRGTLYPTDAEKEAVLQFALKAIRDGLVDREQMNSVRYGERTLFFKRVSGSWKQLRALVSRPACKPEIWQVCVGDEMGLPPWHPMCNEKVRAGYAAIDLRRKRSSSSSSEDEE